MKPLKKPLAAMLLLVVTIIWGSGFTMMKLIINAGMSVGLINMARGFGLSLLILVFFGKKVLKLDKKGILIGIAAGFTNSLGYLLQSAGLKFTTPSVNAFLTILNTIFVPFIALIMFKIKPSWRLLPAVLLSIIGTFLLTNMSFGSFSIGLGEGLTIGCALSFAFSIAILSNTGEGVSPTSIIFWIGIMHGIMGVAYFFVLDGGQAGTFSWTAVLLPLIYVVIVASFLSTTLQVICQRALDASTSSIIMTMEAVFGTLISLLAGYDIFKWSLISGGLLIMCGVIIVLLPPPSQLHKHFVRLWGKSEK